MGHHSMLFAFLASISHLSETRLQIYRLRWSKLQIPLLIWLGRSPIRLLCLIKDVASRLSQLQKPHLLLGWPNRLAEIKPIQSGSHLHMFCITGSTNFTFDLRHVIKEKSLQTDGQRPITIANLEPSARMS